MNIKDTTASFKSVRVWDLPTRAFHWLLVAAVAGLFVTSSIDGDAIIWHSRLGYAVASLLLFRLVWGVVGGYWSRFGSFAPNPRGLPDYLKSGTTLRSGAGHNPLGALSVLGMLAALLLQVATGLISENKDGFVGPLNVFVTESTARLATGYHKSIGQPVIICLVLLHLAAIAFYFFKKNENLVTPMVRGDKVLPAGTPASRDDALSRIGAIAILSICTALVAWLVSLSA